MLNHNHHGNYNNLTTIGFFSRNYVSTLAFKKQLLSLNYAHDLTKMKKLLLLMCLMFAGITSANELLVEETQSTTENLSEAIGDCRWPTCTYDGNDGTLIGCTDWTYGICLDEVVIKG